MGEASDDWPERTTLICFDKVHIHVDHYFLQENKLKKLNKMFS